jgi:type I restriction enzyme S subunit
MFDAEPEGWDKEPLGAVAEIILGQSPPSTVVNTDGIGLPFIQGNAEFGRRSPSPVLFASDAPKKADIGDVLLSVRAPVGEVNVAEGPLCIGRGVAAIRARGCDRDFLFYAVSGLQPAFSRLSQGSTFDAINGKELRQLPIPVPPLQEQRRIAEVLRSVDDAIAAGVAAADQAKEARAHQLERLLALPGSMRPIEDVCRLSGGFGFPMKFQGKQKGSYPFAKVSDMNRPGNEVELSDAENFVDEDDLRALRAKPFPVGTTLFPKVGAALLTNKRRIAARPVVVDNNVMGAVATAIDPWFLFYAFNTIDMADYVQPGAVPSVNQRTIGKIMIPVPSAQTQRDFVTTMRDFDRAIDTEIAALTRLVATKRAIASDLLSGRVRVPA